MFKYWEKPEDNESLRTEQTRLLKGGQSGQSGHKFAECNAVVRLHPDYRCIAVNEDS